MALSSNIVKELYLETGDIDEIITLTIREHPQK